jgi:hypothetical protein
VLVVLSCGWYWDYVFLSGQDPPYLPTVSPLFLFFCSSLCPPLSLYLSPTHSLSLYIYIYLRLLSDTELAVIEETFKTLTERTDIGILLINQTVRTRDAVDCTMLSTSCAIEKYPLRIKIWGLHLVIVTQDLHLYCVLCQLSIAPVPL